MSERDAPSNFGHHGVSAEEEPLLSPEAFTGLFSACLRLACPALVVQVTGDLELETGDGGENPRKAFLDNAYSVYLPMRPGKEYCMVKNINHEEY